MNEIESCSICMEPINEANMMLECKHRFHSKCGIEWLRKKNSCPLCRANVCDEKKEVHISPIEKNAVAKIIAGETSVNLYNSQITDKGACALADALKHSNCKLRKLYLDYNQITDVGARAIADALKHNRFSDYDVPVACTLTHLNLSGNRITDNATHAFADVLKHRNCKLTGLYLNRTDITDNGAHVLTSVLKYDNCMLTKLGLQYNQISDSCKKLIEHYKTQIYI